MGGGFRCQKPRRESADIEGRRGKPSSIHDGRIEDLAGCRVRRMARNDPVCALYTGQRLKDNASLTWANVDPQREEFRFATSKTGRRQVIPIARPLRRHLETLSAGDDPRAALFPGPFKIATGNRDMSALSQQFHD